MGEKTKHDAWAAGENYETYMGRWSEQIALKYIEFLKVKPKWKWADIGCGTGALSRTILNKCNPVSITGIDPSEGFIDYARSVTDDDRAEFQTAGAEGLPFSDNSLDVVASALAINFVPDRKKALGEMLRVVRPGGLVSFYVWDYPGGGMGFIDVFWRAAADIDPSAEELNEASRFPFCTQEGLKSVCEQAGWLDPQLQKIEIQTSFPTFGDFVHPFSLGAGPAPGYFMSLETKHREALTNRMREIVGKNEPITLPARAWAARAIKA